VVGVEGFSFDCEGLVFVVVFSPMNAILDGGVTKGKSSTGGSVFSDLSQGESSEQTNITTQNNTEVTSSANISSLSDDFPTPLARAYVEKLRTMYDTSEMEPVLKVPGFQAILACAGSGKTTTLKHKVNYGILTKELTELVPLASDVRRVLSPVLICTFSREAASELRSALVQSQQDMGIAGLDGGLTVKTLHAEFLDVLKVLGLLSHKNLVENVGDNKRWLRESLRDYGLSFNAEMLNDLMSALSFTRNVLDKKRRYSHPFYNDNNISPDVIDSVLDSWFDKRWSSGYLDFDDIQDILYKFLYDEKTPQVERDFVKNTIASRYRAIFVDEFQDTSEKQFAILKAYFESVQKAVVIGDDDQLIYSWRGSDDNIFHKFVEFTGAEISYLSTNYRCPSVVVDSVVPSIERNRSRFEKSIRAAREGGQVSLTEFPTFTTMRSALVDAVQADVAVGKSVAVLCRVNSDGLLPALALSHAGVQFSVSSPEMTLKSYMSQSMFSLVSLVRGKPSEQLVKALSQLVYVSRQQKSQVDAVVGQLQLCKLSLWQLLEQEQEQEEKSQQVLDQQQESDVPQLQGDVLPEVMSDFRHTAPSLYKAVFSLFEAYRETVGEAVTLQELASAEVEFFRRILASVRARYSRDTDYQLKARAVLDVLLSLLDDFESLDDFVLHMRYLESDLSSRVVRGSSSVSYGSRRVQSVSRAAVKVATVHDFKGREVDSVYIWNDSVGVFPHKKSSDMQEERRLHYVAVTRARDSVQVLALQDQAGCFVHEMVFPSSDNTSDNPSQSGSDDVAVEVGIAG
jgi:ATP-dependent DNA helicase pcrA